MNKYRKLLNNTLIFAVGTFGSKLLSFILVRLYTGCMTTEEYGTADILYQAVNVLYPIVTLSMADALIRFGIDKAYNNKKIYTIALTTTAGGLAVLLLFTPLINCISAFKGYAPLLFIYCFFSSFKQLAASFVRARGLVKLFAIDGIFSTLIIVISNIILLKALDLGVTGYVCSIIISDALSLLGLIVISELYKFFDIKNLDKKLFCEIVKYSLPLVPTYILWWITSASDRYFVMEMVSEHDNGIYSAAHKIPTLLMLVTTLFYQAWQMSTIENKDDKDLSGFYKQVYGAYSSLLFIAAAGLIMIIKPFTYILVDNDPQKNYVFGFHYAPILIIAMIFQCLCQFLSSIYNVRKKSVNSMVTSFVAAAVNITLDILLIPRFGVYGAAFATMTAYFACFMVRVFDTRSYVKFGISWFKMIINTTVIVYMAAVAITEPRGTYLQLITLFISVAVFNFDAVISTLRNFIIGKRRKNQNGG